MSGATRKPMPTKQKIMCDTKIYIDLEKPIVSIETGELVTKIPVQCGKCPKCKTRRVQQWTFRLMQEKKDARTTYFVTLTYDNENVPITKNGFMTLKKKDVQDFIKRLRRNQERTKGKQYMKIGAIDELKIKYYVAGEYGSKGKRPHYHLIIFNTHESLIKKSWNKGEIDVQQIRSGAIPYTLKYINKKSKKPYYFKEFDGIEEFSMMSKGIGDNYLTDAKIRWHKKNLHMSYVQYKEYKVALPKYYRDKIFVNEKEKREYYKYIIKIEREKEKMLETQLKYKMNQQTIKKDIDVLYYQQMQAIARYKNFWAKVLRRKEL